MPTKGSSMILKASMEKRIFVGRTANDRLFGLEVDALDAVAIGRRRQEVDDRVEERLNALVLERRAAEHRDGRRDAARRCGRGGAGSHRPAPGRRGRPPWRRRPSRPQLRSACCDTRPPDPSARPGISSSSKVAPSASPDQTIAFILIEVDRRPGSRSRRRSAAEGRRACRRRGR